MHTAADSTQTRFVYADNPWVPTRMERNGLAYALVNDRRGSVRLVIRLSDNAIVQRLDYDAYGVVTRDTNPGFQPFGYASGLHDPISKQFKGVS